MNETMATNLIRAVVGKKISPSFDKNFLTIINAAFSKRLNGLERSVLILRCGSDRTVPITRIATQLRMKKEEAQKLLDGAIEKARNSMSLRYFEESVESQRNLCHYFRVLFEPVVKYNHSISERATNIRKSHSFDIDEGDPFSNINYPDYEHTSFYISFIKELYHIDLDSYPDDRIGSLCVVMSEIERNLSRYIPCLVNREINCARAERRFGIKGWHCYKFTTDELNTPLQQIPGLEELASRKYLERYQTVGDILSYEAAELAGKIPNEDIKKVEEQLKAFSNGIWGGWNQYWDSYYAWSDPKK